VSRSVWENQEHGQEVAVGGSGISGDGGVGRPSVGFYRNLNATWLGTRTYAVGFEG